MDYRDERDALRSKVEQLEGDLDQAKQNAASDEQVRARAAQLEAEVAALRETATRLEGELHQLRPAAPANAASSRAPLAIALGAVALVGIGGALLFLAKAPPAPPLPVAVQTPPIPAPAPVDVEPPVVPPRDVAAPRPPQPPKLELREGKARWKATVTRAEGLPLAKGSSCVVDAVLHLQGKNEEWPDVVVTCGAHQLYDSNGKLEGMAMTGADPLERFGPTDDKSVFTLQLSDKGTRAESRNQITLDTNKRMALVWSENLPPFKVELSLPVESEPAPPIAERLARTGVVKDSAGAAPKAGAKCSILAMANGHHETCIAKVTCDGQPLVKPTDALTCTYAGTVPTNITRADGLNVEIGDDVAKFVGPGAAGFSLGLDPAAAAQKSGRPDDESSP